jgi:hypothetical protein
MPLKKGQTNNPHGRKAGVPNKVTLPLKVAISSFCENNWQQVEKIWAKLPVTQKISFYEKLLKLVVPPPLNLIQRLSDEDLDRIIEKLKQQKK